MRKVYVSTELGIRRAELLYDNGDWGVTIYDDRVSITHLPTGSRLPTIDAPAELLMLALSSLAELPSFDLQSWDASRDAVRTVLAEYGLVRS